MIVLSTLYNVKAITEKHSLNEDNYYCLPLIVANSKTENYPKLKIDNIYT